MSNYVKTCFLSAAFLSSIGLAKNTTKWGGSGVEYSAHCGVEKELWVCPTTSERCVKEVTSWVDKQGNEVYMTFDTSGELTYTSETKELSEKTITTYLDPGNSMCIYYWVGDRTCAVFPSLDYNKAVSSA